MPAALCIPPQVMLFDEPTAGLDIGATMEVQEFIQSCKAQGKTIILSSHNMAEVEKLCDRIGILYAGKLLATGTIDELISLAQANTLQEAFLALTKQAEGRAAV